MFRTVLNVVGDTTTAMLISKSEHRLKLPDDDVTVISEAKLKSQVQEKDE
ncbi:dicarboxylate/amino acid:cation symporter [Lentilactobacillus raoultii]|uniref:Dicarboxylate/amino acid:cation symporter n=1 Tax=Lentilactobacillus raoultii TaxID=1987503 RepID=A0ABW3PLI5_9LACO|nr:dicarboxylate/amino acid:cation symporter [Lentilactobacillus raoultii]